MRRLKSLVTRIDQGVSPQAENHLADDRSWGVLKAGCVNHGVFRETEHKRLPNAYQVDSRLALRIGDILVSRACGSPHLVGSVRRVTTLAYRLILSDKTFRHVFGPDADPAFMSLAMNSRYYRHHVHQAISGAEGLANNLPLSELRSFTFAIPPVAEQRTIAAHLEMSLGKQDDAIAATERHAALAREYRTRLIADVVTGKPDIREAAAQLPDEDDDADLNADYDLATGVEDDDADDELAEGGDVGGDDDGEDVDA